MEQMAVLETAPRADAECEAAVHALITQMKRMREHMAYDRREIEKLRAETNAILAEMKSS